ncbi:MAG: hypothetical protein PWQ12_179 [Clostridiales bacterium]|nr:hypothetical protein [Clostridiales bacterium]
MNTQMTKGNTQTKQNEYLMEYYKTQDPNFCNFFGCKAQLK